MALSTLASKYDPNSPDYDPTAPLPTATPNQTAAGTPATLTDPNGNIAAAKALTDANKITATTQQYDESTGVAGRVNSLIGGGGALMQTARTQAAQAAAKRGLVNSSLGVQAGEQAVINTATPIATADAQLTSQQNLANQTAQNNASTANAQLGVTAGVQGMTLAQQSQQFGVTSNQQQQQLDQTRETQRAQIAQGQQQIDTQIAQFAQQLGMSVQDMQLRRDTLTAQQQQALDQLQLQRSQLAQQQSQFDSSSATQQAQFAATQTQQLVMQQADADTKRALAELDAASRDRINSSSNIANAWGTMMQSINAIQNNSAYDGPTRRQLIQNLTDGFASFSDFWSASTGVNVDALLNFHVANAGDGVGSGGGAGNTTSLPAYNPINPTYDPNGRRGDVF